MKFPNGQNFYNALGFLPAVTVKSCVLAIVNSSSDDDNVLNLQNVTAVSGIVLGRHSV